LVKKSGATFERIKMNNNCFNYVKDHLDILEVCSRYGVDVDRNKKTLCLWHKEDTASLSFKNNRFVCFGCGKKGSSIDLVMKLFSLEPLEAVQKLNNDYQLGLDLSPTHIADMGQIQARKEDKNLEKAFISWIDENHSKYAKLSQFYLENMKIYKPLVGDESFHPKYIEAVQRWESVNYILDVMARGTDKEKIELYKDLTK